MSILGFSMFVIIALSLQCVLGYKFTTHFSYRPLIQKIALISSFAIIAIVEIFYFKTFTFATLFGVFSCYVLFPYIMLFLITFYLFKIDRIDSENRQSTAFFLNIFKIRSYFLSKGCSNIYFFKNDGVSIYFEKYSTQFERLPSHHLEYFKHDLDTAVMQHVELSKFIVLIFDGECISLSSNDFAELGVSLDKINRQHFDLVRMIRI